MVSSGSTNSVWPLELVPWMTPSSLRRCPAMIGDHEALVADGDELFLEHALLAVGAQKALERFLDGLLLPLDVAAQAIERDAGIVGDGAVGQDLAVEGLQQGAEVADGPGARAEQREALGGRGQDRLGVGGAVEQGEEVVDFFRVEARAFDVELVDGGLGVGKPAEIDADRGAASGGLRARRDAEVLDRLAGFGEVVDEAVAIVMRLEFVQLAPAHRARDVAPDELPQRFEFEDFRGGFQARLSSRPGRSLTVAALTTILDVVRTRGQSPPACHR